MRRILLGQIEQGDGRSAARAARAIFEEVVTFAEVENSSGAAAVRYAEHALVTSELLEVRRPGVRLLPRNEAREKRRSALGIAQIEVGRGWSQR